MAVCAWKRSKPCPDFIYPCCSQWHLLRSAEEQVDHRCGSQQQKQRSLGTWSGCRVSAFAGSISLLYKNGSAHPKRACHCLSLWSKSYLNVLRHMYIFHFMHVQIKARLISMRIGSHYQRKINKRACGGYVKVKTIQVCVVSFARLRYRLEEKPDL